MKIPVADVSRSADELKKSLAEETPTPFVITREGKPVAALIPLTDMDIEAATLSMNQEFIEVMERSRARAKTEGTISHEEMVARYLTPPTDSGEKSAVTGRSAQLPKPTPETRATHDHLPRNRAKAYLKA